MILPAIELILFLLVCMTIFVPEKYYNKYISKEGYGIVVFVSAIIILGLFLISINTL